MLDVALPYDTVTVTLLVPAVVGVPLMTPLPASIPSPDGRPVALYVSASPSASSCRTTAGAPELREKFFNTPELKKLIEGWTDDDIGRLNRGGHDVDKVYAAYAEADADFDALAKRQAELENIIQRDVDISENQNI